MPTMPFTKRRHILPIDLGFNSVVVANCAPVTGELFSVDGSNQVTLNFSLDWVAATAVTAYLETSDDRGVTVHRTETKSILSGVETMSPRLMSQAVSADEHWKWEFGGMQAEWARLVVAGTGGTTDAITVSAEVGVV